MVEPRASFETPTLNRVGWETRRVILTTVHRRESMGEHLEEICDALEKKVVHRGLRCEAIAAGAVNEVLPLNKITGHLMDHLRATVGQALSRV